MQWRPQFKEQAADAGCNPRPILCTLSFVVSDSMAWHLATSRRHVGLTSLCISRRRIEKRFLRLVRKFPPPPILCTPVFLYSVYKAYPFSLSWARLIQTTHSHPIAWRLVLTLWLGKYQVFRVFISFLFFTQPNLFTPHVPRTPSNSQSVIWSTEWLFF